MEVGSSHGWSTITAVYSVSPIARLQNTRSHGSFESAVHSKNSASLARLASTSQVLLEDSGVMSVSVVSCVVGVSVVSCVVGVSVVSSVVGVSVASAEK